MNPCPSPDEGRAKAAAFLHRLQTALDLQHADLEIERRKRLHREQQRAITRWRSFGSIPVEAEVVVVDSQTLQLPNSQTSPP